MKGIWDTVLNEIQFLLELKDTITNAEHCKGLFSENKTQEPHLGCGGWGLAAGGGLLTRIFLLKINLQDPVLNHCELQ